MASEIPAKGMIVFDAFPSIRRLGQARLQQLCDGWTATAEAAACDITSVEVGDEDAGFPIQPRGWAPPAATDERLHKILVGLFTHIVTHGFSAEQELLGRRIIEVVSRPLVPPQATPPPGHAGRLQPGLAGMALRAQAVRGSLPMRAAPVVEHVRQGLLEREAGSQPVAARSLRGRRRAAAGRPAAPGAGSTHTTIGAPAGRPGWSRASAILVPRPVPRL